MRNEYPRPELVRDNWVNLNGEWDFEFDFANTLEVQYLHFNHIGKITHNLPKTFSKKINVPFCPESKLSGIEYTDYINACWYKKVLDLSNYKGQRIILHFEAAFHTTNVFVDGKHLGKHCGGYTPFSFELTEFAGQKQVELLVHCYGDARNLRQPSGKQEQLNYPWGCFYVRSTGIWSTVWLEILPKVYVKSVKLTPDVDNRSINAEIFIDGKGNKEISINAILNGKIVGEDKILQVGESGYVFSKIKLETLALWDLENPNLYDLEIKTTCNGEVDFVKSYFGMRKLETDEKGLKLNGKRVFQRLVLDQGYYPDGLYTAPNANCFEEDIKISKKVGFNGARLHQKVFERRFLYEADKQGYLIWGEYASWGFDFTDEASLLYYLPEWLEVVERDYNHPSLIGWCPFNENWHLFGRRQCDEMIKRVYLETKRLDSTRPVIDVSWNYHVKTDYYDVHDYTQDLVEFDKRYGKFEDGKVYDSLFKEQYPYNNEPFFISEYGGLKWPNDGDGWGYNEEGIKTEDDFVAKIDGFQKIMYKNPRISAACYTQLYDVQQECNGLYYYDRKAKFSEETLEKIKKSISSATAYEDEE